MLGCDSVRRLGIKPRTTERRGITGRRAAGFLFALALALPAAWADSVNSPNITLNVDTNRSAGAGAGGVAVTINTVTIAETMLPEYSSGGGNAIRLRARPGFQFDPTSPITAVSVTIGLNGNAQNVAASVTPTGAADEIITFELTSGTSTTVQDIIRVNGIKLLILSEAGAAGPAQTTVALTTSTAGGAFTEQGIIAANITRGAADRLVFSAQPGSTESGGDILPAVKLVDFGGNLIDNDPRTITLALQENPGAATLLGTLEKPTTAGVATWDDVDDLRIATAAAGYTLRASASGPALQSFDTVDSEPFEIVAGAPNRLTITQQPQDTVAGGDILLAVAVLDQNDNVVTSPPVSVTLDSAVNPGGWPLLVDTSLTKETVNGVATWDAADNLRINRAITGYVLSASGVGGPIETDAFDVAPAAPALLRFVQQPGDVQEDINLDPPVTVEVVDEFLNRTPDATTVDLVLQSACGGVLSNGSATAEDGVATFDALRIDTPCVGVVLEAAAGDLPRVNSDSFTVTALPPAAVRFVQQPTDVVQGVAINPPVTVEIIDDAGQRTDSEATVELTLLSSCGGVLSATSAQAVGGLATFAILEIDTACPAVSLQATSEGLSGDTSETFDVLPPEPAALRFVQQPTEVQENELFDPPVSVEIVDVDGVRTGSTARVELTLISACGGELSATTATAVDGLATFQEVAIDTACEDVRLRASANGVDDATSDAFLVTAADVNNPCGLCGQGALFALAPLFLMHMGARRIRRRGRAIR